MDETKSDVLLGTLEMLTLKVLLLEPMHGWGISQRLQQLSGEVFQVNQGSLYPALQRMLTRGWVRAEWRRSDHNRRARYYAITAAGRRQLGLEIAEWRRAVQAVELVLTLALAEA